MAEYLLAGQEPPLEELFEDPIMQMVMESDHVDPADVRAMVEAVMA
ncbi:MAG: hypothetical protein J0L97_00160 [Alphaproteobacteria bacterium]|nr:hypothetical protein [Alphaproteobacteria bacterium]